MARRPLQILVGVESVLLVVLGAFALGTPPAAGHGESRPAVPAREPAAAPAAAPAPAASLPAAAGAGLARTELDPAAGDDGAAILLFGALKSVDGAPLEEPVLRVWRPGNNQSMRILSRPEGHYAFAGLTPGTWELSVKAAGCREHKVTLELAGQPPRQRRDVVLERALLVKVKFVTPEGTPLQDVKDLLPRRFDFPILAVATRAQPAGNLPLTEHRDWSRFGLGEWQPNDPAGFRGGSALALPKPWAGQLDLREAPPCFVSAVYRHLVLATQGLAPGQTELSFTITPEQVKGCAAAARVRVLDRQTKAPIVGARVAIDDRQTGSQGTPTDAQGEASLTGLSPGLMGLSVYAKGYEQVREYVRLTPGQTTDLGTLELNAPVQLTGTVTDPEGKPAEADVIAVRLDRPAFPQPTDLSPRTRSKDDGSFELAALGPGQYLVRASRTSPEGVTASAPVRVDATSGSPQPVRLMLGSTVAVTLDLTYGRDECYLVQAVDAAGVVLWALRQIGGLTFPVHMPAGSYTLEVWSDQQVLRRIPLRVAAAALRVEVKP